MQIMVEAVPPQAQAVGAALSSQAAHHIAMMISHAHMHRYGGGVISTKHMLRSRRFEVCAAE